MRNVDYIDLANGEREKSFFFVLNAYLHSRIDRKRESVDDEEVNVYMAHLLHSLVDGRFYTDNHQLLATTPADVFTKGEECDSNHHKLKVSGRTQIIVSYPSACFQVLGTADRVTGPTRTPAKPIWNKPSSSIPGQRCSLPGSRENTGGCLRRWKRSRINSRSTSKFSAIWAVSISTCCSG